MGQNPDVNALKLDTEKKSQKKIKIRCENLRKWDPT